MNDSDDDMPISSLIAAKKAGINPTDKELNTDPKEIKTEALKPATVIGSAEIKEFKREKGEEKKSDTSGSNGSSSSSASSSAKASSSAPVVKKEKGSVPYESDDDLPISELMKRKSKPDEPAAKKVKPEKIVEKVEKEEKKLRATAVADYKAPPGFGMDFYETKKGNIAQKLLCRWWYAIDWPKLEDIEKPPPGYEILEGFMGVFVSTRTDSLGTILDLRPKATAPCLTNFAKMSTTELKALCVTAYEKQMEALTEAEAENTTLMAQLKHQLKNVKKINSDTAESEAAKFRNGVFTNLRNTKEVADDEEEE
jgi:hypothetical protein